MRRGEHWAVLGANGSGKSTLLSLHLRRSASGARRHDRARRSVAPARASRTGSAASAGCRRSCRPITIARTVARGDRDLRPLRERRPERRADAADRRSARRWLEFFGIERLRDRGPRQVSYGQMRLALIARAMVNDPELLLLDEPCTGLDGDVRERVLARSNGSRAAERRSSWPCTMSRTSCRR